MSNVLIFKITQFLVIVIFTLYISDLRKKEGSQPLMDKKYIWVMKFSYVIPIAIYGYTLITMSELLIFDYLALLLTILGASIVIKSKTDLGDYHVWTGYKREKTKLVIQGIYRWIRHPLYAGIFVFIFGSFLTIFPHIKWSLLIPFLISLSYISVFLVISSKKETAFLRKKFGDKFSRYCERIHPFLPLQKYED